MDDTLYTRVDRYIEELFGLNDPVLQQVLESTVSAGIPEIQVSSSQGRFLYLLAKLTGARRILEIGSLAGYSTICLGRALPAGGRLISLELIEKHAEVTRHHLALAGLADRAVVVVGPAGESLAALVADGAEPFDLVFIDADKISYPVSTASFRRGDSALRKDRRSALALSSLQRPSGSEPRVIELVNRVDRIGLSPIGLGSSERGFYLGSRAK